MKYPTLACMTVRLIRWFPLVIVLVAIFAPNEDISASARNPEPSLTPTIQQEEVGVAWTVWDRDLRSMSVDEPGVLWLGGTGGIIRFDLATKTYDRISSADGLPHHTVSAIAVDERGNRWFGSDKGLSRLDAQGRWRHYNSRNSGLHEGSVSDIAIDDTGVLWASHGLPNGAVSRRDPDGGWRVFGTVVEAINYDYDLILHTRNTNRLWTVVGTEVWVGYQVFDGVRWSERRPFDARGDWPAVLVSDKVKDVWIVDDASIYQWDGSAWKRKDGPPAEIAHINGMVVVSNRPWIAWTESGYPYGDEGAHIAPLDPTPHSDDGSIDVRGPVIGLDAVDDGVAAMGDGWILHPDGSMIDLSDLPRFRDMVDAFHLADDVVWIYSRFQYGPTHFQEMYELHHQGTSSLADDVRLPISIPDGDTVALLEAGTDRDVWAVASDYARRVRIDTPYHWSNGQWSKFPLPQENLSSYFSIKRIYVENERSVWYLVQDGSAPNPAKFVFHLRIGGTSQNTTDVLWNEYPVDVDGKGGGIAVDLQGRLLFFNSSGLYRFEDDQWKPLYQDGPVCETVPASDGEIIVAASDVDHCTEGAHIFVRRGTDDWEETNLPELCHRQFELFQSAQHPNRYWSVASDGTIWYPYRLHEGEDATISQLRRCSDRVEKIYPLPFDAAKVGRIQVNGYGQPWLFENRGHGEDWFSKTGRTWRMSTLPDFHIEVHPTSQLAVPGDTTKVLASISARNGFAESTVVDVEGVADGITATLDPDTAMPGESVSISLLLDSELPTGLYDVGIFGESGLLSHAAQATTTVVEELQKQFLPAILAQ